MTYIPEASVVVSDQAFTVAIPGGASIGDVAIGTAVYPPYTIELNGYRMAPANSNVSSTLASVYLLNPTTVRAIRENYDHTLVVTGRIKQWR